MKKQKVIFLKSDLPSSTNNQNSEFPTPHKTIDILPNENKDRDKE